MGHNGTDYNYLKGDNNPAKRLEVRTKISIGRKGKCIGKEHQFFGKKRPEHSMKMKGSNNPNYGNKLKRTIIKCLKCNKDIIIKEKDLNQRKFCSRKCSNSGIFNCMYNSRRFKEKNPNWLGGISKELYPIEWTEKLKNKIRRKFNYRCQECFRHQNELITKNNKHYKLIVHHIDFNKDNCSENNLIPLCRPCHIQTNYNRENWISYFQNKQTEVL